MADLLHEIKDTPIPTLLVIGGIIFLILAVAGRVAGRIEVDPQRQRLAAIIGALLLGGGILLYLAPTSLLARRPEQPIAPPASAAAAAPSAAPEPEAAPARKALLLPTTVEVEPPAPTQPSPTIPAPTAQRRSAEDSLRDYWRAVSEQRYEDAWARLSANFRFTTHGNDFGDYVRGYQEQALCGVEPDEVAMATQSDDYALISATVIYRKGADCVASPLALSFHMAPADDQPFWRIDRVELR